MMVVVKFALVPPVKHNLSTEDIMNSNTPDPIETYLALQDFVKEAERVFGETELCNWSDSEVRGLQIALSLLREKVFSMPVGSVSDFSDTVGEDDITETKSGEYTHRILINYVGQHCVSNFWLTSNCESGGTSILRSFKDLVQTNKCFLLSDYFTLKNAQEDCIINAQLITSVTLLREFPLNNSF